MSAKEYIETVKVGGYDQAEYVSIEDALKAVELAKMEGWNNALHQFKRDVRKLCNVRQVIEYLYEVEPPKDMMKGKEVNHDKR